MNEMDEEGVIVTTTLAHDRSTCEEHLKTIVTVRIQV